MNRDPLRDVTLEPASLEEQKAHPRCALGGCRNPAVIKMCAPAVFPPDEPERFTVFLCKLCAAEVEACAGMN